MNAKNFQAWLIKNKACSEGLKWAKGKSMEEGWKTCERPDWMMWLYVVRPKPDKERCVMLAIIFAESVLENYERQFPDDKRPRLAIEAAKAVVKNDTEEKRSAARSAAMSAASAASLAARSAKQIKQCDEIRKIIPKIK